MLLSTRLVSWQQFGLTDRDRLPVSVVATKDRVSVIMFLLPRAVLTLERARFLRIRMTILPLFDFAQLLVVVLSIRLWKKNVLIVSSMRAKTINVVTSGFWFCPLGLG